MKKQTKQKRQRQVVDKERQLQNTDLSLKTYMALKRAIPTGNYELEWAGSFEISPTVKIFVGGDDFHQ